VVFVFMGGIVARTVVCGGHARSGPETESACQQWHEVVSGSKNFDQTMVEIVGTLKVYGIVTS